MTSQLEIMRAAAKEGARQCIDGHLRMPAADEKLNELCRQVLTGPRGDEFLDYLRSITTSAVLPHTATDAELRMMEGKRQLVAILDMRRRSLPPAKSKQGDPA